MVPVAEQKQTENKAKEKGNKKPEMIDKKIDPGIAKV